MERIDFKLLNGDLVIENNDITMLTGNDVYVQALRQILSTRLGEYFLNTDEGLDFDVFLGKKEIDDDEVMNALQLAAEQVEDFVKFISIEYEYNRQTRNLSLDIAAQFADNTQVNLEMEVGV